MIEIDELMERFIDFVETDETGDIIRLSQDATPDAVSAYGEFTEMMHKAERNGVKI